MSVTQERPGGSAAPAVATPLTHGGLNDLSNGAPPVAAPAAPSAGNGLAPPVESSPRAAVATQQPRIFYGWWMVGAGFLAAFTTAGAQGYIAGSFLVPMSDELGWTRAEFLYGQTVGQFFMAFAGFFVGAYVDRYGARPLMFIGATLLAVCAVRALRGAGAVAVGDPARRVQHARRRPARLPRGQRHALEVVRRAARTRDRARLDRRLDGGHRAPGRGHVVRRRVRLAGDVARDGPGRRDPGLPCRRADAPHAGGLRAAPGRQEREPDGERRRRARDGGLRQLVHAAAGDPHPGALRPDRHVRPGQPRADDDHRAEHPVPHRLRVQPRHRGDHALHPRHPGRRVEARVGLEGRCLVGAPLDVAELHHERRCDGRDRARGADPGDADARDRVLRRRLGDRRADSVAGDNLGQLLRPALHRRGALGRDAVHDAHRGVWPDPRGDIRGQRRELRPWRCSAWAAPGRWPRC